MVKTIGLMVGLSLLSTPALAQSSQGALEACYQQPDGAPRLACFNREMQRRQTPAATGSTVPAPAAATVPQAAPVPIAPAVKPVADDTVGLQGEALRKKLRAEDIKAEPVKPIVATIVRVVPRPHDAQAFVLDNGQTWEEVGTMSNLNIKLHDKVTIRSGMLGAFFLNTPESQRIRVHRIL